MTTPSRAILVTLADALSKRKTVSSRLAIRSRERTFVDLIIDQAVAADQIAKARTLFEEYADSLGVDLCFQGFAAELAGLPGTYAPLRGRLLLATAGGEAAGCVALRPLGDSVDELKRL
jgi:hypothetical protein